MFYKELAIFLLFIKPCFLAFFTFFRLPRNTRPKDYYSLQSEYVLGGLAEDWWCLVKAEWIDTSEFGV